MSMRGSWPPTPNEIRNMSPSERAKLRLSGCTALEQEKLLAQYGQAYLYAVQLRRVAEREAAQVHDRAKAADRHAAELTEQANTALTEWCTLQDAAADLGLKL